MSDDWIYLDPAVSQAILSQQQPTQREQGSVMPMDTATVRNTNANVAVSSWDNTLAQPFSAGHVQGLCNHCDLHTKIDTCGDNYNFSHIGGAGAVATNNCSSSIQSPSSTWPSSEVVEQENVVPPLRGEHFLLQHALCYLAIVLCMA